MEVLFIENAIHTYNLCDYVYLASVAIVNLFDKLYWYVYLNRTKQRQFNQ